MICVLPFLTTACQVDGPKYFRPDDRPPATGEELRPLSGLGSHRSPIANHRTATPRSPKTAAICTAPLPSLRSKSELDHPRRVTTCGPECLGRQGPGGYNEELTSEVIHV
jgi:hypothetical protein